MCKTNSFERVMLFVLIVGIPFQQYVPTIGRISLPFVLIGIGGVYLLVWRLHVVQRICRHPVFLAGYAFVALGMFFELAHSSFGFSEVIRIAQMLLGAIILGSLCRDTSALKVGLYGVLTGATLVALLRDQDLQCVMGENGYASVQERFLCKHPGMAYEEVYRKLLGNL